MKKRSFSVALAGFALALCSLSHQASAVTMVSIESQDTTTLPAVDLLLNPTPIFQSGSVLTNVTGLSVPDVYRSPFEDYSTQTIPAAYLAVPFTSIGSNGIGTAIYNTDNPQTSLVMLWGSPDSYNTLEFWSGQNGTGNLLATFTGSDLLIQGLGHDLVTFLATDGTFSSVSLSSNQAAFEFAAVDPPSTPLPAALPLFATGLGVMGYLARRRKKRMAGPAMMAA